MGLVEERAKLAVFFYLVTNCAEDTDEHKITGEQLAEKIHYSDRHTDRILAALRADRVIEASGPAHGRRGLSYRINRQRAMEIGLL